jgi:hypothetical protein
VIRSSFPHPSVTCLALLCALSCLSGCAAVNGGNPPSSQASSQPSIAITPATAQLRAGDTQRFVATGRITPVFPGKSHSPRSHTVAFGPTNRGVIWSVNDLRGGNASVGTIDTTGLYTAPATLPNPNFVKVTAVSSANLSLSAMAPITLENPIPAVTSVSPGTIPVGSFKLTVKGRGLVRGAQVLFAGAPLPTTFNSSTQLTATGVATQAQLGSIQISVQNPDPGSATSTASFSVQVNKPAVQISVNPPNATLRAMDTQQFTATIQGTSNSVTRWSVNGVVGGNATVGSISAAGVYTAPATPPSPNLVKVTTTSAADPSVSATVPVTLNNPIPVVSSISPKTVSVGNFTLTINGQQFVKGVQVLFAGRALQTSFNSASRLTAIGTATEAHIGSVQVLLTNPAPGSANSSAPVNLQVTAPADPAAPDLSQVPSQDPAGIFDGKGNFDTDAYISLAKQYGTSAMIPERFGKPWTAYHTGVAAPTWRQAASIKYISPVNKYDGSYYSLGTPCAPLDSQFNSNYAQAAYVTDPAVPGSAPGVDGILTLRKDHCAWAGQPQLYWAMGGGYDGHPTITLRLDLIQRLDPYGMPEKPVEVVRAYGASEWAGCSYMVFQSGQIACGEAANSGEDFYYFRPLPANFSPTAASVTNNGEFLLVTGWNTDTYKGEVAVLAMGSSKPPGTFWGYEWTETYPGFRNYSLPVFNKLLGIMELPGMIAPTAIEAVGNWVFHPGLLMPGNKVPGYFPLSDESNWQCFATGSCANLYDTRGFALVASRYERKVLLLDLSPLFQMVRDGMFTSWTQFRVNVANTGTGPGQWPPTFAEEPSETPTITKSIEYKSQVTAISASLYPDNRALIATEDGQLHVWNTDGLQTGTGTGAKAEEMYSLGVGRNITRIAHMKHWLYNDTVNGTVRYQYVALSRGDKTVKWIDLSNGTPKVIRTLVDSRLVDPISVEDNDNHQTQSDLINIADYGGKDIKGYRYGPVIFYGVANPPPVFGMGTNGTDPFEYEGAYATPTGPFSISGENVP